ncbi:GumC family protein [Alistipes sp.]|uniref:GumC family protein n=1 Tax=Alistipes sp. TaxID=1872444 RepID=UPI003AEF7A3E
MTAYIAYLVKFLFRIKWWLILCPTIVAILVYLHMGRQARTYLSSTTIYTGIVSGYDLETGESTSQDWNVINNAMDNLINIIKSQTTLKNVSMRLYAQHMVHGDPENDNKYIFARNYRSELRRTPQEVLDLIDRSDEEKTIQNLYDYEVATHDNHVYGLFHWMHRYYSYEALSNIQVKRIGNSDMLEISYENDDPGVVFNTLEILNDEFVKQYRQLRFGETNNVIAFFESELKRVSGELRAREDSLRDYNIENLVINYDEQTKHIAILSRDFELRNEEVRLNFHSANKLREAIEKRIDGLSTFRNNAAFIQKLHSIGDLQSRITAAEAFIPETQIDKAAIERPDLAQLHAQLESQTDSLRILTSNIATQRYTKEGISTNSMIDQWLEAVMLGTKSEAEMLVLDEWKQSLDDRYMRYAPVGATLKRKNREIGFSEQSYLSILHALNMARLRQKNLQMSSATLKIINPPVLPIAAEPTKRKMMVAAAFFSTLIFLLGFFILLELLDRTLRDKIRAERITGGRVIGAFPGPGRFGQRRYAKQYREVATRYMANAALNYFDPARRPNVLNILSTEPGDGKSILAEHLAARFRESGLKVRTVSWNTDFDAEQKAYLLSERLADFVHDKSGELPLGEADVVLVEYPPLSHHSVPRDLLREAALNIFVAPATRTWKETDQLLYEKAVKLAGDTPTALCLNCAGRDVVQTFTGLLPPYTRLRRLSYQISQFGFTAVR